MISLKRFTFPKRLRLRFSGQYHKIAIANGKTGGRKIGEHIVVEYRMTGADVPRLGITVSRRFGKAHKRNRFKRIVREAFRVCQYTLLPGLELNVKPNLYAEQKVASAKTADIVCDLTQLFQQLPSSSVKYTPKLNLQKNHDTVRK